MQSADFANFNLPLSRSIVSSPGGKVNELKDINNEIQEKDMIKEEVCSESAVSEN